MHTVLENLSTESEWIRLQRLCFHVNCSFGERCLTKFAPLPLSFWKCWLKRTKRRWQSETEATLSNSSSARVRPHKRTLLKFSVWYVYTVSDTAGSQHITSFKLHMFHKWFLLCKSLLCVKHTGVKIARRAESTETIAAQEPQAYF